MKINTIRIGRTLLVAAVCAGVLSAAWVYNAQLVNQVLTSNQTYTINLQTTPIQPGITRLSAQAVYSSATVTASSFTDGHVATGTVTVLSASDLVAKNATNQITVAATNTILAASATNFVLVLSTASLNSAVITYRGNALRQGHEWTVVATTTGTAQSITNAFNNLNGITATRSSSEVDLVALPAGSSANGRALSVNVTSITVGGSGFGGGHNNRIVDAVLTLKGVKYPQGQGWDAMDTSSETATSIASWLNRQSGFRANAVGSVVFATATVAGTAANSYTLSSSAQSYLTVSGATFAGGLNNAAITLHGVTLTQGSSWTRAGTASGNAKAISDAIMANPTLNSVLRSTWTSSGIVYTTSTLAGSAYNYGITSNAANLTAAGMNGGVNSAWLASTSVIALPSHGLSTGQGVVFSTGSSVALSPLVGGTTYYAARIDANDVALSSSAASALAGNYITLGAPSLTGPHIYTLTPQGFSGTPGLRWYVSNDGSNFNPLAISSATITPAGITSTVWDFGHVNFKYMQLQATGPTTGGLNLVVTVQGAN